MIANEGFQYFSITVSMAKSLGINDENKLLNIAASDIEREYLRSLWWWIYKWDRFLIYKNKNCLNHSDNNVYLPSNQSNGVMEHFDGLDINDHTTSNLMLK